MWRRFIHIPFAGGVVVQVVRVSAIGLGLLTFAGCGGDRFDNRVAVSGQVKQGGQPLAAGSIVFIPKSGTPGPGAEGKIVGGQYEIAQDVGPTPGVHRVLIALQTDAPKMNPRAKQPVPKGRRSWGIEVQVPAGETFTKDFELR